jgi:formylglycine-generating enzyme required for sulfatase activity
MPDEAEWESAALGASGISYATYNGQLSNASAVFDTTGPAEVASKAPNPFMFYDMTGNLFEWTDSWWTDNGTYQLDNEDYPKYVPFKVIKGGSFKSPASDPALKIEGSYSAHPASDLNGEIGFRVVIENSTFWNYFRQ